MWWGLRGRERGEEGGETFGELEELRTIWVIYLGNPYDVDACEPKTLREGYKHKSNEYLNQSNEL